MIPDDERVSRAMHALEPPPTDTPDLFERVAAGARKRRRRTRSASAVAGAAVAVAAVALVPTLTGGTSRSNGVQTLSNPDGDIDPGFTGHGSPAPTTGALGGASATTTNSFSPSATGLPHLEHGEPPLYVPTPLPTDAKGCPTVASLPPGPDAATNARAAAVAAIPARYGSDAVANGYTVTSVYPAKGGQGFGVVADAICGKALGDDSYVVELGFASDSASVGSGQLFVANFTGGWQVWFQYH